MQRPVGYWSYWWAVHVHWWADDARLLLRRTGSEFLEDRCTHLAAGISYYVIFSIFPMLILFVSISALVLTNEGLREDVLDRLFDLFPLEEEGQQDLREVIEGVSTGFSAVGLISILGLVWSASGMMGALRTALNQAWDIDYRRPYLRGKAVDMLMIVASGALVSLSIGSTAFLQVARHVSDDLSDSLGPLGAGSTLGFEVVAVLVPFLFSFVTFLFIFDRVPSVQTRIRHIWPGALLSAVLFEVVKNGFLLYLRSFGDFNAVFGPLGVAVGFLFFTYVSANILLLGAEMAAEWPRVIHGHYDDTLRRPGPGGSLRQRLRGAAKGLIHAAEPVPEQIEDAPVVEARRQRVREEIARRREESEAARQSTAPPSDAAAGERAAESEESPAAGERAADSDESPAPPPER